MNIFEGFFDHLKKLYSSQQLKSFDKNRFEIYPQQIGNGMRIGTQASSEEINNFGNIRAKFSISKVN